MTPTPAAHPSSVDTTATAAMKSVAVTGASGFIGSRLVPALAGAGFERIVGLDVRDPQRSAPGFEHHLVDVASCEVEALIEGVHTVVHLAGVLDPIADDGAMARANVEGTRRLLDAAAAVGVRAIVRVSPTTVYGAWATNPVPLTEDAPLRPNPGFGPATHAAEVERLLYEWQLDHPEVTVSILRSAPVMGAGAEHLWARVLAGWRRVRIRGESAPVQVVHVDDLVRALTLMVAGDHPGVFDVAAPGWLGAEDVRALFPRGALPPLPLDLVRRLLSRGWRLGIGEVPPSVLPYLLNPWIVATDRIETLGWRATYTNEETLLETHEAMKHSIVPAPRTMVALAGAGAVGAASGYAARRLLRN